MLKKYVSLMVLFNLLNTYCMEPKSKRIEINGENKSLLDHITKAATLPDHLKKLDFIRYNENIYYLLSEGTPHLNEQDKKDIGENNFVYSPFYAMKKRGSEKYEAIGAVIVGTRDKEHFDTIRILAMRQLTDQLKKTFKQTS